MHSVLKYCFGLPEVGFEPGQVLITENKGRGPLYILVEGCVAVTREGIEVARIDTPGAIFGEMSALLDVPHTATVTALTAVRAHRIEQPNQFLDSRPQIALQVAGLLAQRLHDATSYLVEARRGTDSGHGDLSDVADLAQTIEAIMYGRGGGPEGGTS